jgi:hypothetical protein
MTSPFHIGLGFLVAALAGGSSPPPAAPSVIVVGNAATPPLDEATLQRVYLGKVVEIDGRPIIPVNLQRGSSLRKAFMEHVLTQDDDKFIAYWTVRHYIGQGTPPREFATLEQQLAFVRATPGAVGYADNRAELGPGLRPLLTRKP